MDYKKDNIPSISISSESTQKDFSTVDDLIVYLGEFGRFQKLLFFFMSFPSASMAIAVYAFIFLEYEPSFQCNEQSCQTNETYQCQYPIYDDLCQITEPTLFEECDNFTFNNDLFSSTTVTEFKAVCSSSYLADVSKTTYMSGMLFGSFLFGWLSDRFGRKICFAATVVCLSFGSATAAASVNYSMYIAARFVTSMGAMGVLMTGFVLIMEFVGPSYRTMCGFAIEIPFALGELYVGVLAYFMRDWRHLQIVIAVPFFALFLYLVYLPESIRWSLSKGHQYRAQKSLEQVAKVNKIPLPEKIPEIASSGKDLTIFHLLRVSKLRSRLAIICFNWIVTTICYYGLAMSTSLSQDLFTSFLVSAAMEIPSYVFCMLVVDRWGRRPILSLVQILAATACITAGCLPDHYHIGKLLLIVAGKFGSSAAFAIVWVYTAELFPTPLRNSAIGLCSTCARVGGICAPLIPGLSVHFAQLPYLVMGVPALAGGLTAFLLPETMGKKLPDTLEEAFNLIGESIKI